MAMNWGGYLKIRGETSFPPATSPYRAVGPDIYCDGNLEGRLTNALFLGSRTRIDTHYEIVGYGGDAIRAQNELEMLFDGSIPRGVFRSLVPSDDSSLMDLTGIISETDESIVYQRIDRLAVSVSPDWGTIVAGRQAVTWGNGFLFNPMDLFNPFAPTAIDRDYKTGDDMLFVQLPAKDVGNVQTLYVPRRNLVTGDVDWDDASLAAKVHLFRGSKEFDLLASKHYKDHVVGAGGSGYLGNAAWRMDITWTLLDSSSSDSDYLSFVANLDYSWIWWEKNLYGFLEFFYSGIGKDNYQEALSDPEIVKRIARGELFTLGRTYLAGNLQLEIHPLVNLFLTAITNIGDPSGVLQPRLTWDITSSVQLLAGGNIYWGSKGSEYGGIPIANTPYTTRAADNLYAWVSYYF